MGRIFDVGQEATGFIAIGQFATGFFAFGQVATGVIAIGQVARGFFVIGQAGFGLLSVGMASGGLIASVGMLGVGGRGLGGIIPLVPRWRDPRELPPQIELSALQTGAVQEGWVPVTLRMADRRTPTLEAGGAPTGVRLDARLRRAAAAAQDRQVLAFIRRSEGGLIADRMLEIPPQRIKDPRWWAIWAAQLIGLAIVTVVFWFLAAYPVFEGLAKVFS